MKAAGRCADTAMFHNSFEVGQLSEFHRTSYIKNIEVTYKNNILTIFNIMLPFSWKNKEPMFFVRYIYENGNEVFK
jgi:hypothetical protein